MTVGADVVNVEVVGEAHLADVEFEAPFGNLCGEGEGSAFGIDELVGQADCLVNLYACEIGLRTEGGVANDIEVSEARESECLADAAAAGGFEIGDEVGGIARIFADLVAEKEGADERCLVLSAGLQAVRAVVGRVKRSVCLKDNVRLSGNVITSRFRVGKDRG
jgi:hypothetical protein